MRNKLKIVLFIGLPMFAIAGIKPDKVTFENGEIFKVKLSKYDFNRLYVMGEKVTKARYSQGAFHVDTSGLDDEEDDGAVYIKPALHRISTMYINTDKGHNFAIEAIQDDLPGKSINFVFNAKHAPIKSFVEGKQNHDVLHEVRFDKTPAGYKRVYGHTSSTYLNRSLRANLISHYQNKNSDVYKYQIENIGSKTQLIPFGAIKTPEVSRFFIETTSLKPHRSTVLVSLVSHKRDKKHV